MFDYWLNRRGPLPDFYNPKANLEYGAFISLDVVHWAYEAESIKNESLKESWKSTHDYYLDSLEVLSEDCLPSSLDKEEVYMIKTSLGSPPALCYPVYFVSVGDGIEERLVYIGMTSSSTSRFKGGHSALIKLLNPKYNNLLKRIYLGTIMLLDKNNNYLPLEWLQTENESFLLLKKIEAGLIHKLKPELNTQHISTNLGYLGTQFHIQNFTNKTIFFNDEFISI